MRLFLLVLLCAASVTAVPGGETTGAGDEPGLGKRIDDWFGTYVSGPLWDDVLAVPILTTRAVEVFRSGDEDEETAATLAKGAAGILNDSGIVVWREDGSLFVAREDRKRAVELLAAEPPDDPRLADKGGFPFILLVLVFGALFFTLRFLFVNCRLFTHAIACVRGRYDDPDDPGEISHFKALSSALSATVGLGNIAGVAVAIAAGGAGAVFWMWVLGFFGMSLKMASCTMSQFFRRVKPDGTVLGGPMVYLQDGLREVHPLLAPVGKLLGVLFAIFCIFASLGGGNLFQGKMTFEIAKRVSGGDESILAAAWAPWAVGVVLAFLVGLVIIGGIKRIGAVTSKLVPSMCLFYCAVCLVIVCANLGEVPALLGAIVGQAFSGPAVFGGFLGVLATGFRRAAFSNEAGLGSAAIAHAAAKTKEPVREGLVAMIGPFIDTLCVCTMTALAILITGVQESFSSSNGVEGAAMTAEAFASLHAIFAYALVVAVAIFAYSTMISWSYYGERCTEYLTGNLGILPYRIVFTLCVVVGPVFSIDNVLNFADCMLFSMAIPNIVGLLILNQMLARRLRDYQTRLRAGEMKVLR